ncbi:MULTISPECIES: hypothetical protein [unclassified Caldibacillus]|uniref:hypothetical protein n=1 Tax=unclassified Caldibacillus TaxID=2641266 RepID=UPI001D07B8EF|nr:MULTISPECIES: hypothetical protein [unclassified Caldibacillus]
MVTRRGLVAKIEHFPPQNDDEKGLVAKKEQFPVQNGDEKGSRRQKIAFIASKWRRE